MLKWFTKKKEDTGDKSHNEKKAAKSNLRIKKRMSLPRNFAKKVIDLELQCERPDVTRDHINSLMDLYTVSFSLHRANGQLVGNRVLQ